jgi:hypothetical protein
VALDASPSVVGLPKWNGETRRETWRKWQNFRRTLYFDSNYFWQTRTNFKSVQHGSSNPNFARSKMTWKLHSFNTLKLPPAPTQWARKKEIVSFSRIVSSQKVTFFINFQQNALLFQKKKKLFLSYQIAQWSTVKLVSSVYIRFWPGSLIYPAPRILFGCRIVKWCG